ncbi:hypothetical protein [Microcystis aeruginosa]|uniref:Uncharacterized protein n=1 Tax=Microcystis aeruginosa SPC777 TaxID=482300 RepID=S3JBG9_MICAE|nr:hypothetical protein [Microcystis aeruginosa]EPF22515.1 hypothetical protein MAESPC_01660 [Microcystis aeruginosa SPC777]
MAGVYKIEISESEAELKELLRKEKTGSGKERRLFGNCYANN